MRKRSKTDLPATLADASSWHICSRLENSPLHVHRITYLHFHRQIEIGLCVTGEGICHVEGKEMPFRAGDVQIILPYQKHINSNSEGVSSVWRWMYFSPRKLFSVLGVTDITKLNERLQKEVATCGVLSECLFPKTHRAIKKVFAGDENAPFAEERLALDCYDMLLSLLEESVCREKLPFVGSGADKMLDIAPALRRIQHDVTEGSETSIAELAALCHCSPPHLRRLFHATLNTSPKEYLIACRIRHAKQLLTETDDSILSIALLVGYRNISGFNRAFFDTVGETPSAYRTHTRRQ